MSHVQCAWTAQGRIDEEPKTGGGETGIAEVSQSSLCLKLKANRYVKFLFDIRTNSYNVY